MHYTKIGTYINQKLRSFEKKHCQGCNSNACWLVGIKEKGKEGLLAGCSGKKRRGNPYPSRNIYSITWTCGKIKGGSWFYCL